MTVVINKLFQPLTYQIASGAGLHLPPRGRVEVPDNQVSEEMRRAAQRGFIALEKDTPPTGDPAHGTNGKSAGKKEG
jgi:hypothetical protein